MAFFEWNDSYSVGVVEIDRQHQRLIDFIDQLYEAMEQGHNRDTLTSTVDELRTMASVLDELIDYSVYHFSTEEEYMLEYAYPEYDEHKGLHGQFAERAKTFKRDFDNGEALLSMEIMQFMRDWWKEHILGSDKKYGPFFNEKGLT